MNYWFKIFYITALSRWTLTPTSAEYTEFTAGSCSFSSYNRVPGYILRGNVLSEYTVPHGIECRKICDRAANCLSVNLLKKSEKSFLCQLNKARKENSPSEQFVKSGGGEYFGMKKRSLCKSKSQGCISETPWHSFNQSYFMLVETTMTWQSAREYCVKENSDLASISSDEELTFLYETFLKVIVDSAYIGFHDINSDGNFAWSDGTPVVYSKFNPGEPDNHGGTREDCVVMSRYSEGKFSDIQCGLSNSFLCEVSRPTIETNPDACSPACISDCTSGGCCSMGCCGSCPPVCAKMCCSDCPSRCCGRNAIIPQQRHRIIRPSLPEDHVKHINGLDERSP